MDEALGMILVMTPPKVSIPSFKEDHCLIGVDTCVWFLAIKELLDQFSYFRDMGGTSYQKDLIDLVLLESRVVGGCLDGAKSFFEEVGVQFLESRSSEHFTEVKTLIEGFDFDFGLMGAGKSFLGLLDFILELLDCSLILGDIIVVLLLDQLDEVVKYSLVEVLSSQMGVSVGADNFKDSVVMVMMETSKLHLENKDVSLFRLLMQTVGDGCGSWFIEDSDHVEGYSSCVLSGLSLGVVEVGGHCDITFLPK